MEEAIENGNDNDRAFERLVSYIEAAGGTIDEPAGELIEDAIMLFEAGNFTGCLAMMDRMPGKEAVNE